MHRRHTILLVGDTLSRYVIPVNNRRAAALGFVVGMARRLAERVGDERKARALADLESHLGQSPGREDTLCRASLPEAERRWLAEHRPDAARHWNLLTDWTVDALRYVDHHQ